MSRPQIITLELEDCSNSLLEYVENLERALAYESDWAEQALQSRKELKQRNAELAAQVEALEAFKDEVIVVMNNSQGVAGWHLNGDIASWDEILPDIPESTPAQCLTERDREVAAKAGRDGFIACAEEYGLEFAHASKNGIERNADKYYSKIKSGEVSCG